MATTKTSSTKRKTTTTKKTTPKKKPVAKKTTTKRSATTKRTAAKTAPRKTATRKAAKPTRARSAQSFKLHRDQEPFVSLKITVQTLYWLILAGAVLLLGLWVLDISQKVQAIYDEIDANMMIQKDLDERELEILREKNAQKD